MPSRSELVARIGLLRIGLFGLLALAGCDPAHGVPIFLWHSVGEGNAADVRDVSPDELDQALTLIDRFGARPITLDQLFDAREGKGKLPDRAVVLTFDDGRACLYAKAVPVLLAHRDVAEAFVIAGDLAEDEAHRHAETDAWGTHRFLLWSEAAAMARSGAFRIESHSLSHPYLGHLGEAGQRREIVESRRVLQQRLEEPVDFFAYPFGAYTWASRNLAEGAGYRGAVTVQKGLGSRYAMKRISVYRGAVEVVRKALVEAFGAPP